MSNAKQNMTGEIIYIHDDIVDIKFFGYIPSSNETIDIQLANGHIERAKVVVTVQNVCRVKSNNAKDLVLGQECVATGKTIMEEKSTDEISTLNMSIIKNVIENMRSQVESLNKSIDTLENIVKEAANEFGETFAAGILAKMSAKPFPSFGTMYADKIDDDSPTISLNFAPDATKDETSNNKYIATFHEITVYSDGKDGYSFESKNVQMMYRENSFITASGRINCAMLEKAIAGHDKRTYFVAVNESLNSEVELIQDSIMLNGAAGCILIKKVSDIKRVLLFNTNINILYVANLNYLEYDSDNYTNSKDELLDIASKLNKPCYIGYTQVVEAIEAVDKTKEEDTNKYSMSVQEIKFSATSKVIKTKEIINDTGEDEYVSTREITKQMLNSIPKNMLSYSMLLINENMWYKDKEFYTTELANEKNLHSVVTIVSIDDISNIINDSLNLNTTICIGNLNRLRYNKNKYNSAEEHLVQMLMEKREKYNSMASIIVKYSIVE